MYMLLDPDFLTTTSCSSNPPAVHLLLEHPSLVYEEREEYVLLKIVVQSGLS